jgi:hypothetical protein
MTGKPKQGMRSASEFLQPNKTVQRLIQEALALEIEDAKAAGSLGFMARALVQATMPHSKPEEFYFERRNGAFTLTMMAPPKVGLPYGIVPRMLMIWLSTEAVKTRNRELILGDSLSAFMGKLNMLPTGGRWGSITRLKTQAHKLFTSTVSCVYQGQGDGLAEEGFRLADKHVLWWNPKTPDQSELFNSLVVLSEPFYKELVSSPVPINMDILHKLPRSPLAIDIFVWLSYRMSYLRNQTLIPWESLQAQFGANYTQLRDFKANFLKHLKSVTTVYPKVRVENVPAGLVLKPSPTSVPRLTPGAKT